MNMKKKIDKIYKTKKITWSKFI